MHPARPDTLPPTLPIVVQIGFAGSRSLYADGRVADAAALDDALLPLLVERLDELRTRLGLAPQHRWCGVAQLAIGGDLLFARALEALGAPLRILLPQRLDDYLDGGGSHAPDFLPEEAAAARAALARLPIAEVRVVSEAETRDERFREVNREIVRESDLVVALVREAAAAKPGGTRELVEDARRAGKPVWLLEVGLRDGRPVLSPWQEGAPDQPPFAAPGMPAELAGLRLPAPAAEAPHAAEIIDAVRRFASDKTRRHSGLFKRAAVTIVVLHIGATVLATLAGKLQALPWIGALLAFELLLLGWGLRTHHALHRGAASRAWARTRLLAETLRSMSAGAAAEVPLADGRTLAFPLAFQPLLRSIAVLQRFDLRRRPPGDWRARRDRYVEARLTGDGGQLRYFAAARRQAAQRHAVAQTGFWLFSGGAFVATAAKLAALSGLLPEAVSAQVNAWGGFAAITLPVAAVGFLSWSAASDLEARTATYAEMHAFLSAQTERLRAAASAREFERLVRDTEHAILSENLGWFSRRLFRGVA